MPDVRDALIIGKRSDGSLVRRPLSPHLQVYKPQVSSVTSIMHRVTGIALSVGLILMFGWTLSLWYHFFNGIRHLLWDMGWGFEIKTSHQTALITVVATGVLTVISWIFGLAVWL